jgi:hypothetical protein
VSKTTPDGASINPFSFYFQRLSDEANELLPIFNRSNRRLVESGKAQKAASRDLKLH